MKYAVIVLCAAILVADFGRSFAQSTEAPPTEGPSSEDYTSTASPWVPPVETQRPWSPPQPPPPTAPPTPWMPWEPPVETQRPWRPWIPPPPPPPRPPPFIGDVPISANLCQNCVQLNLGSASRIPIEVLSPILQRLLQNHQNLQ